MLYAKPILPLNEAWVLRPYQEADDMNAKDVTHPDVVPVRVLIVEDNPMIA
jgi:hypothetical protein